MVADNDELRAAVEKACHGEAMARGGEIVRDLVLVEFVVIAARKGWNAEGQDVTQVVMIPHGGADHQIAGLLRDATLRMDAEMMSSYVD